MVLYLTIFWKLARFPKKFFKNRKVMSLKASELVSDKDKIYEISKYNYKCELDKCFTHIRKVWKECKNETTYYSIPYTLYDNPYYDKNECIKYLKEHLYASEFYVRILSSNENCLYISWKKNDVDKVKIYLQKQKQKQLEIRQQELQKEQQIKKERKESLINWHPQSAISDLKMKTFLMKGNPKYSHLKSINK